MRTERTSVLVVLRKKEEKEESRVCHTVFPMVRQARSLPYSVRKTAFIVFRLFLLCFVVSEKEKKKEEKKKKRKMGRNEIVEGGRAVTKENETSW